MIKVAGAKIFTSNRPTERLVSPYLSNKQKQLIKGSQSQKNIQDQRRDTEFIRSGQNGQQTAATSAKKLKIYQKNESAQLFNDYGIKPKTPQKKHTNNHIANNIQNNRKNQRYHKLNNANTLGLSAYEFQTTIQGRLLSKSNHHIDFCKNRTNKINNVNRLWYDNSRDLQDLQQQSHKKRKSWSGRIHNFNSYSGHKLFFRNRRMQQDNGSGNGGLLDKVYDVNKSKIYNIVSERVIKDKVDYRSMTPRPDLKMKLGTNLNHETYLHKTMGRGNSKRPLMEMSHSQRRLVFSRQVISPKRGCYR